MVFNFRGKSRHYRNYYENKRIGVLALAFCRAILFESSKIVVFDEMAKKNKIINFANGSTIKVINSPNESSRGKLI